VKKLSTTVVISAIIVTIVILGGKFFLSQTLNRNLSAAISNFSLDETFLYDKLFLSFDGTIGLESVWISPEAFPFIRLEIEHLSFSNGNLLNMVRLLWYGRRAVKDLKSFYEFGQDMNSDFDQAGRFFEKIEKSYGKFELQALGAYQLLRAQQISLDMGPVEICGAKYYKSLMAGPADLWFSWGKDKDKDGQLITEGEARLPGLANYRWNGQGATIEYSSNDELMRQLTGMKIKTFGDRGGNSDNSWVMAITEVSQMSNGLNDALLSHCAKHLDVPKAQVPDVLIAKLDEISQLYGLFWSDKTMAVFRRVLSEPGTLTYRETLSGVTTLKFNDEVVQGELYREGKPRVAKQRTNPEKTVTIAAGKFVETPIAELKLHLGKKVRVKSKNGKILEGRLKKVERTQYEVTRRYSTGEVGVFSPITNIAVLEVWTVNK
jgi:hypothetical protein